MEKTTRRLPIVERDEWLLPAEQELNRRYERYTDKINAIEQAQARSSTTPTATAISAGSGTSCSTDGGCANGCRARTTSTSSGISTTGSVPRYVCSATRTAYGAPSSRRRCTATGSATGRSTSSTSTATTAGKTASRPMPRAWYRTRRRRITRPSSGRRSRSTGRATRSTPRRTAAS